MQITIYVQDELVKELDRRARKNRVSRSRYVQELLRNGFRGSKPEGTLSAFGKLSELNLSLRSHLGTDAARERLK